MFPFVQKFSLILWAWRVFRNFCDNRTLILFQFLLDIVRNFAIFPINAPKLRFEGIGFWKVFFVFNFAACTTTFHQQLHFWPQLVETPTGLRKVKNSCLITKNSIFTLDNCRKFWKSYISILNGNTGKVENWRFDRKFSVPRPKEGLSLLWEMDKTSSGAPLCSLSSLLFVFLHQSTCLCYHIQHFNIIWLSSAFNLRNEQPLP